MKRSLSFKIAVYGLLLALALVLSWVETILPFVFPVPGMKIGLANIVIVTVLYTAGPKEAALISFLRLILVMFTFGNAAAFMYSLAGAALSFLVMGALRSTGKFSPAAVSIAGGCMHNVGQIIIAALVLETSALVYYLPWLLTAGSVSGLVIGILGGILAERTRKLFLKGQRPSEKNDLETAGKDVDTVLSDEAVARIKNTLLIDKIAKAEDIKLSPVDIQIKLQELGRMYGIDTQTLTKQLSSNPNAISAISQQAVNDKVRKFLVENNTINYVKSSK